MRKLLSRPPSNEDSEKEKSLSEEFRERYVKDVTEKLIQAIELGAIHEHACNYAGISTTTFNKWRKEKPGFEQLMVEAEGRAAIKWLAKIEKEASRGTWQAAAWKLERRYPEVYGRTYRTTEQTGPGGGPIRHTVEVSVKQDDLEQGLAKLNPEQLMQLSEISKIIGVPELQLADGEDNDDYPDRPDSF